MVMIMEKVRGLAGIALEIELNQLPISLIAYNPSMLSPYGVLGFWFFFGK